MTTDTTLEFRNNQDMFNEIQPANVNIFDAKNSFNQASMGQQVKPAEPQEDVGMEADKIRLMNTVMAPNETLTTNVAQGIEPPPKGEINELSKGVAGVAMEVGVAFMDVFRDKSMDAPEPSALENKLAMNMQPRPTQSFGMGIGGGPGG